MLSRDHNALWSLYMNTKGNHAGKYRRGRRHAVNPMDPYLALRLASCRRIHTTVVLPQTRTGQALVVQWRQLASSQIEGNKKVQNVTLIRVDGSRPFFFP
jgi:hypothetical protein